MLFSDWARSELFEVPTHAVAAEFRHSLGLGNELLVVHAGNMGVKQGLEVILGAAERSREDRENQVLAGWRWLGSAATGAAREVPKARQSSGSFRCCPMINFWICWRRVT